MAEWLPTRFRGGLSVVCLCTLCACSSAHSGARPTAFRALYVAYKHHFITLQGRVADRAYADQRTTSEGQAYGLFFALVSNDPALFQRMLAWTQANLARGNLDDHLPSWLWGINKAGHKGVLDKNSAADADTWMAYTLIEAGHLWHNKTYTQTGRDMAQLISKEELLAIPQVGPVLLPGRYGFGPHKGGCYTLNMSYLPLPLLTGLGYRLGGLWKKMARALPKVIRNSAENGFLPNWTQWCPTTGFGTDANKGPYGSYGAIRVYLWAGITNHHTPGAAIILANIRGMSHYLRSHVTPPTTINITSGIGEGKAPVGFSAALLPYLKSIGASSRLKHQETLVRNARDPDGLYGKLEHYYDQNLALFATGFLDHAYYFHSNGTLEVSWQ